MFLAHHESSQLQFGSGSDVRLVLSGSDLCSGSGSELRLVLPGSVLCPGLSELKKSGSSKRVSELSKMVGFGYFL